MFLFEMLQSKDSGQSRASVALSCERAAAMQGWVGGPKTADQLLSAGSIAFCQNGDGSANSSRPKSK